ncbi:MAG: NUDIX hydrolase [Clostridia bacterium]|nr:NUDIX hydrolase [Clostridia bacterium]
MELFEKKLNSRQIFDGVVVKLFVDDIELPNGKKSIREIVRHPGAVCVIPVDEDENVIMIKQFRYPFSEVLLEIPAGKLEPNEDPLEAVKRELEEESGVNAESVEYIGTMYTTVAILDEKIHMYLATGLTYKNAHPDDGEFLEVVKIPLKTLVEMVMDGKIPDSKTQIAILKAEKILAERKNKVIK